MAAAAAPLLFTPPIAVHDRNLWPTRNMREKRVGFTTPAPYALRLEKLLQQQDARPISAPSISVQTTPQSRLRIRHLLLRRPSPPFSGIAFTSRAGIAALQEVLLESPDLAQGLVHPHGDFFIAALGKDADLVLEMDLLGIRSGGSRIDLLFPDVATPGAMVKMLGEGRGRSVLCPVPSVEGGLEEPPVVPQFLAGLAANEWLPVRLDAYVTSWMGAHCALPLLPLSDLDALLFTSTAEVEGLLMSLKALQIPMEEAERGTASISGPDKKPVIAVHGPVTAAGVLRFGIKPDVVSRDSSSFQGIIDALELYWESVGSPLGR